MASFSAELHVAGRSYPLLSCEYSTHQDTDARGRVNAKVRHSPVLAQLDVPRDSFLPAWAADAYKRCAVDIVFSNANGGRALETLHMAGAYCVSYGQAFREGSLSADTLTVTPSSYVAHLMLSDPDGFTWQVGGPGAYAAPAAGVHGLPSPGPLVAVPQTAAQELLAKQQRYNKRLNLLGRARTQLAASVPLPAAAGPLAAATDATRVDPGTAPLHLADQRRRVQEATERLARNNVAVERARLSEHVYHSLEKPPRPEPPGWHMLNPQELARKGITPAMLNDPKSGFKAALYQSGFERPPKLVVAYAGTETGPDWATNLQQGIGLETKQYNSAMNLAQKVVKTNKLSEVDITGHSLGGGLASAAVAVTGAKGYTFNAAGLHPYTVAREPYNILPKEVLDRGQLIDAFHSTADPLTNLQSGLGALQSPGTLGGLVRPMGPEALGIPRPLVPAEGWQHEWKELVRRNPLATSTNMALEGHGVDPQMVDNIEVQKDQDTATLTKYVGSAP